MKKLYVVLLVLLLTFLLNSISRAKVPPHAEWFGGPMFSSCYIIYDENNKAVAGNCK